MCTLSAVHRGVAFEKRALSALSELSMSLRRVGGRNDGGVDLQGWWWVPETILYKEHDAHVREDIGVSVGIDPSRRRRTRIRVLAQCKAEKKKLGPGHVREMEGTLHRYITSTSVHADGTERSSSSAVLQRAVALLVSSSEFTKAAVLSAQSSSLPLLLIHVPSVSNHPAHLDEGFQIGEVGSAIWNPALGGSKGLFSGQIELLWERNLVSTTAERQDSVSGRPVLWYRGERLESWAQPLLGSEDG